MDNYGKFEFSIDLLAFELGKLCPGMGIFVSFFDPGGRSFPLKSCPRGGILTEKLVAPGSARGGEVTGQIDTCITNTQGIRIYPGKLKFILVKILPDPGCLHGKQTKKNKKLKNQTLFTFLTTENLSGLPVHTIANTERIQICRVML